MVCRVELLAIVVAFGGLRAYRREQKDIAIVGAKSLSSEQSNQSKQFRPMLATETSNNALSDASAKKDACLGDGTWFVEFRWNHALESPTFFGYYEVEGSSVRITDAASGRVISEPEKGDWFDRQVCVIDYKLKNEGSEYEIGEHIQMRNTNEFYKAWKRGKVTSVEPLEIDGIPAKRYTDNREWARWKGSQKDYLTLAWDTLQAKRKSADGFPIYAGSHWVKDHQIEIGFAQHTSFPRGTKVQMSDRVKRSEEARHQGWVRKLRLADPPLIGEVIGHIYSVNDDGPHVKVRFLDPNGQVKKLGSYGKQEIEYNCPPEEVVDV